MDVAALSKKHPTESPSRGLPNEVTLALGQNIKQLRIAADKSQIELAMDAELERSHVSRIERGMGNPSLLTLATLCHCLGTTLPQLFDGINATLPPTAQGGALRRDNQARHDKPSSKGSRRSPLR
ncbi:helix-turn-helix domain-containing protein [Devosia sp.]|uniref:helix-turn-helix domain-containing protein n=1 Tax=Devosia sp. TaxID=1871048 RepID=UPI002736F6C4|nr:helix-turn-helix transcriptional regulator [Devosia sp.]MDP2780908.1 helix-turn-helix transcriptional regulator [Devosia sp.]